jgi:FkbM family methyltransferase
MKQFLKAILRSLGFDLSRLSSLARNRNQPGDDPFLHQKRLAPAEGVKVIFDIGANRGQTTPTYRKWFPEATIYCFEPFAASFATLKEAFPNCRFVQPFQLAVSDGVGTRSFYCANESVMNSLLPLSPRADLLTTSTGSGTIEVQSTTLDAFCSENNVTRIDILKIDVQGAEVQVLSGATGLLRDQLVRMVYLEVNFNEIYLGQAFFHDVSGFLHSHGYSLYGLYQMAYSPVGPIGWADALFVSPKVMEQVRQAGLRGGTEQRAS